MDSPAETEVVLEDTKRPDGVIEKDEITSASVVYEWQAPDTCLPGCYWLEFKVIKMLGLVLYLPGHHWHGPTNTDANGVYWTGTTKNDGSAQLSYDSVHDKYKLSTDEWTGPNNLHSANYYTGTDFTDSSVVLSRTNAREEHHDHHHQPSSIPGPIYPNNPDWNYYDQPIANVDGDVDGGIFFAFSCSNITAPSVIPSFVDEGLTPSDFGCIPGLVSSGSEDSL